MVGTTYSVAVLQETKPKHVKMDVVHADTTFWSLAWVYVDSVVGGDVLHITCGFSKDERANLTQFNYR